MLVANLNLIAALWDAQLVRWVVWVGLVVLTVALLLLIRTRWGQQKPLGKCVVLSLLAHLLLAIYMTTVNIVTATSNSPEGKGVHVAIVDGSTEEMADSGVEPDEWTAVSPDASATPLEVDELAPVAQMPPLAPVAEPERETPSKTLRLSKLPDAPPSEDAPPPELEATDEPIVPVADKRPAPVEIPEPEETPDLVPPPERVPQPTRDSSGAESDSTERPPNDDTAPSNPNAADGTRLDGPKTSPAPSPPELYQGRQGDHLEGGKARGATKQTEAAVVAALRWLAKNQSGNGRWDARRLGGGAGLAADNENRQGAGATADTGLTGLALLAFLASGHTHLEGAHRDTVRRGLEFLLVSQEATGSLAATNNAYERMYCHSMATCAVSEAYAMTGDRRLLTALTGAIGHTVRNQDRASGGWRYLFGQPGDTSQLGWQVMALKSAELGGIAIPAQTRTGIERFLRRVTSGRNAGLACYQPERPRPTRSMTAEAMVCRQFLGHVDPAATVGEASGFLLQELPGEGVTNHYYWYYATIALYQAGGEPWRRWNQALQKNLLATQRLDGWTAGSWDPDPVWGRVGGRVYSTALCTLCLEVYYRYLPLLKQGPGRQARGK